MLAMIILTIILVGGFCVLFLDRDKYEICNIIGITISGVSTFFFIIIIWNTDDIRLENIKDYMNSKTKIEIIYKKQIILNNGIKDTIDMPVDTILVENK